MVQSVLIVVISISLLSVGENVTLGQNPHSSYAGRQKDDMRRWSVKVVGGLGMGIKKSELT